MVLQSPCATTEMVGQVLVPLLLVNGREQLDTSYVDKSRMNCTSPQNGFSKYCQFTKKFDEINFTMSDKMLDLFACNETRLDSTITDGMIRVDGYDIIRKDRSRTGGGVCIYLRITINYQIRDDLVPPGLEAVCIEIDKPCSRPFVVITVYRPPNAQTVFFNDLEQLVKTIDDENKEIYILGDLNCDLLKSISDQPTTKLKSIFEMYQLTQLIDEATRITMTSNTLIDHFITNTQEKICKSGVIHTGISDHSMIYAIRKINITIHKNVENISEIRNMKNFNGQNFLNDLLQQPWKNIYFFADNPNGMWDIWEELFLQILDKHAPLQKKNIKSKSTPWITSNIKNMISTRDKFKRKAMTTKLKTDWENYKRMRNDTSLQIRQAKKSIILIKLLVKGRIQKVHGKQLKIYLVNKLNTQR